ncbi:hypothetical protein FIBSPDRAFT_589937 [Athelia psychrophila]|uniref:Uncharacterized protein n=1 Tax=Athelia psychrophila TaxID=1759441 RepID=A0A166H853_9AGAM|nr:hypothetical protein FIBSPDRAFT_589937 [Fibularhizoctonia sp. CBS 109695]
MTLGLAVGAPPSNSVQAEPHEHIMWSAYGCTVSACADGTPAATLQSKYPKTSDTSANGLSCFRQWVFCNTTTADLKARRQPKNSLDIRDMEECRMLAILFIFNSILIDTIQPSTRRMDQEYAFPWISCRPQ